MHHTSVLLLNSAAVLLGLAAWRDLRNLLNKAISMIKSVAEFNAAMTSRLTALETVEQGIKALLSTQAAQLVAIRAQLANAGVPPEQLAELDSFLTTLDTDTASLTAAAVAAGTVAEGEPQPEPVEQVAEEAAIDPEAGAGDGAAEAEPEAEAEATTGKKK